MISKGAASAFVVLPGTGSDAAFARAAFGEAASDAGAEIIAVEPNPRRIVAGYLDALQDARRSFDRIVVGGISIGAAVALEWTRQNPLGVLGVLAVLPAWTGTSPDAPAALSARSTASALREHGLDLTIAAMSETSPLWLSEVLTRAWTQQWPDLPAAFDEASAYNAPTAEDLQTMETPVSLVGAVDDPIHPMHVAQLWDRVLPRSISTYLQLRDIGRDPAILGSTALAGLRTLLGEADRP